MEKGASDHRDRGRKEPKYPRIMAHLLPLPVLFLLFSFPSAAVAGATTASWCVARSDASRQALQRAMDYACGAGADCAPISTDGLCFLPNTIQAHASYAYNSYYHRRGMAPGSCDFSGTATVAKTDPSYGSCVYPSSTRGGGIVAGGGPPYTGTTTTPTTSAPFNGGGGGGDSAIPIPDESTAAARKFTYVSLRLGIFLLVQYLHHH